jgi:hypothetical protein
LPTTTLLATTLLAAALLAATLLATTLLAAALLAATLFFALVWILFCVHDAFLLIRFRSFAFRDWTVFKSNRRRNRFGLKHEIGMVDDHPIRQNPIGQTIRWSALGRLQLALSCVTQTFDPVVSRFDLRELTGNKLLRCWRQTVVQGLLVFFYC